MNPNSLDLRTLRRYDAEIASIIDKTTAVIYIYAHSEAAWGKSKAQGTLFLIERRTSPYYQLMLLSRWKDGNYSICLSNVDTIDVDGQYIMLTLKNGEEAAINVQKEAHIPRFVENMRLMHKLMLWYHRFAGVSLSGDITWKGTGNIKAAIEDIVDVFKYGTEEARTMLPPFTAVINLDTKTLHPVQGGFRFTFRMNMKLKPYQFRT